MSGFGGFQDKFSSALGQLKQAAKELVDSNNSAKTRKSLVAAAGNMDTGAIRELHKMYAEGIGVEKDPAQAWFWARLCGDCGDAEGDYLTALYYKNGTGVAQNWEKAWQYMERAVRRGCSQAISQYEEITGHFQVAVAEEDVAEAIRLKAEMAAGNQAATWKLAHMYAYGCGVLVDYNEAVRLAEMLEQKGQRGAKEYAEKLRKIMAMPGEMLEKRASALRNVGNDMPNNEEQFLVTHYSMLAARKGHAMACSQVAAAYHYQKGVKRDYNEALYYHGKTILLYVAKNDMSLAGISYLLVSKIYALGLGVEKNERLAEYYFKLAKKHYDYVQKYSNINDYMKDQMEEAQKKGAFNLAEAYYAGYDCVPDMEQAVKYYEFCVSKNYIPGYNALIKMNLEGYVMPKNPAKALDYIQRCAKGVQSTTNPNLWRMMSQSTICGLVLRAYNYAVLEFHDVLTADMALRLCREAYHRQDLYFAAICREAARIKGAANADAVWQELSTSARNGESYNLWEKRETENLWEK